MFMARYSKYDISEPPVNKNIRGFRYYFDGSMSRTSIS
jgi:hypothetical protein